MAKVASNPLPKVNISHTVEEDSKRFPFFRNHNNNKKIKNKKIEGKNPNNYKVILIFFSFKKLRQKLPIFGFKFKHIISFSTILTITVF